MHLLELLWRAIMFDCLPEISRIVKKENLLQLTRPWKLRTNSYKNGRTQIRTRRRCGIAPSSEVTFLWFEIVVMMAYKMIIKNVTHVVTRMDSAPHEGLFEKIAPATIFYRGDITWHIVGHKIIKQTHFVNYKRIVTVTFLGVLSYGFISALFKQWCITYSVSSACVKSMHTRTYFFNLTYIIFHNYNMWPVCMAQSEVESRPSRYLLSLN